MKVLQPNCKAKSMERDSLNQQHVTQRHTSTLCFGRVEVGKITVTVGKLLMKFIAILVNVAIGLAMYRSFRRARKKKLSSCISHGAPQVFARFSGTVFIIVLPSDRSPL